MSWPTGLSSLYPMAIALAAGAAVPFQAGSNAALSRALGNPLWATLCSLLVSVLIVLALMLGTQAPVPAFRAALHGPGWLWLGGVAGVAYVTAALVLTPKLGAAGFIVCVIAGQMLASLAIDHYGLMGLSSRPANALRWAGVTLILAGMVVVQIASVTAPARPG